MYDVIERALNKNELKCWHKQHKMRLAVACHIFSLQLDFPIWGLGTCDSM